MARCLARPGKGAPARDASRRDLARRDPGESRVATCCRHLGGHQWTLKLFVSSSGRSSKTAVCLTSRSQECRAVQPMDTNATPARSLLRWLSSWTGITLSGRGSIQLHVRCFQICDDERCARESSPPSHSLQTTAQAPQEPLTASSHSGLVARPAGHRVRSRAVVRQLPSV
jgi:hypothetical protein